MVEFARKQTPARLTLSEAIARLGEILGCSGREEITCVTALADYTRARVFHPHLNHRPDSPARLVHSQLVLSEAKRDMHFLFGELTPREFSGLLVKKVFRSLTQLGDIAKVPGGWKAPGPFRVVAGKQEGGSLCLLLGGQPTELLQNRIESKIRAFGCARFAEFTARQLQALDQSDLLISIDDWLGGDQQDLQSWTRRFLNALIQRMEPWPTSDLSAYEGYLPSAKAGKNWVPIQENKMLREGAQIIRGTNSHTKSFSFSPWYLVYAGGPPEKRRIERFAEIPFGNRLKLLFGIERMRDMHRSVSLKDLGATCHLHLGFKLPLPERKVLDLGWPVEGSSSKEAKSFEFAKETVPILAHVLSRLDIEVKVEDAKEVVN